MLTLSVLVCFALAILGGVTTADFLLHPKSVLFPHLKEEGRSKLAFSGIVVFFAFMIMSSVLFAKIINQNPVFVSEDLSQPRSLLMWIAISGSLLLVICGIWLFVRANHGFDKIGPFAHFTKKGLMRIWWCGIIMVLLFTLTMTLFLCMLHSAPETSQSVEILRF